MTTDAFIMIVGKAIASPSELVKLSTFKESFLCFAPSEVTRQNERFLRAAKKSGFTSADREVCQQAKAQVINNPQLMVLLQKTANGQVNILSFQQVSQGYQNRRKSLVEKLTEIEQMLGNRIQQANEGALLLCQAIVNNNMNHKEKQWIKNLEEAMVQHLQEAPLKVEELAAIACLSSRQLHRRIQLVLGVSPAKLIREVQLQLARQALESGHFESMIQVALSTGFEHASTFSTSFKQRFGCSPGHYLQL